jgi:ribosomal protein S18 acetylase RimI-like enzyme
MINAAFAVETFLDGTRTDEPRLAAMMKTGVILVAENEAGEIVASIYTEHRGRRGYIGMLAVDPSQQCKGLARRITAVAEEHLRTLGCTGIDLTVLNLRPELPPIYRRLGYAETGTEEFHPTQPLKPGIECHCIVMSKEL